MFKKSLLPIKRHFVVSSLIIFLSTGSALVYALFQDNIYTSGASIMPLGGGSANSGFSQLAAQFDLGGLGLGSNKSNSLSKLLVILNSQTMANTIIDKYKILPYLFPEKWDEEKKDWKSSEDIPTRQDGFKELTRIAQIYEDKKYGTIAINVTAANKIFSADLANYYIDELTTMLDEKNYTEAKKKRKFIGEQLVNVRKELLLLGKNLSNYYQSNSISSSRSDLDVPVDIDHFKLNIEESVPAVAEAQTNNAEAVVVGGVPQKIYLEFLGQQKGVLTQLNVLLEQQYALARIEEEKDNPTFQIIDRAEVPEKKSGPRRVRMVESGFILGFFLAAFYMLIKEKLIFSADPETK